MSGKTLAFEIGTEEIPAFDLHDAIAQVEKLAREALDGAKISHDEIKVYTTPRRIIVVTNGVESDTQASVEEYRGPACRIAYDEAGAPTKAAIGFARGKGVDVETLVRRSENGEDYVYAVVETPALHTATILPDMLLSIINGISWPKSQRWGSHNEQFSRPVRWLFAMLGEEVIPLAYAGLTSSNLTFGHRFLAPGPYEIADASALIETLEHAYVVPSEAQRENIIREQVAAIETRTGLVAELPAKTMAEVVNLCEYPTVMVGQFDELFLAVPKEITVDAMLVHQRYFPLFNADGTLTNKFLITSNGDAAFEANIVDGNERVVAARLYDAKFFYDEDLKQPLEAYVDKLSDVVFQEQLGTTRQKTDRIVSLAESVGIAAGLDALELGDAKRAAYLCKADLVSGAVVEFTSVQGIMGRYYALASGENERVAQAIAQHYQPKFAGGATPDTAVGKVVAIADKLDTICGLFAIKQGPTGSSDPFALRRSAIGIIAMLSEGIDISLEEHIEVALANYADQGLVFDAEEAKASILDFFVGRAKVIARDNGAEADTVEAVLAAGVCDPRIILQRSAALEAARSAQAETFEDLATAYARANNLREASFGTQVDEAMLDGYARSLFDAVTQTHEAVEASLGTDDYAQALSQLASLRAPIDAFFENVMVMDDDEAVRANNLRLLNLFVDVFQNVADFGKMAKA